MQTENRMFAQIVSHYIDRLNHQHWSLTFLMVRPTQKTSINALVPGSNWKVHYTT